MASFLLSECLEIVFLNLIEPFSITDCSVYSKDLHSCTLVSRHWCRISTPLLYAYPFRDYYDSFWDDLSPHFKLIRTLLSCVPQSEIRKIYTSYAQVLSYKHIPFSSYSDISPTFNYISFIHGLIFNRTTLNPRTICIYKETWLSAHNPERISSELTVKVMNYFIKFLGKHCNNLTMLRFSAEMDHSNIIELSQFISSLSLHQRRLKHIIFSGNNKSWSYSDLSDYSTVLYSLSSQSKSLQILEFKYLSFTNNMNEKDLNLLCLLKNIRVLKLGNINGLTNLNSWAKNLTKLREFEIRYYSIDSKDFLIQLFQSSSNTLTKLVIVAYSEETKQHLISIYQQISLYLHSLIHLEIPIIHPTELISIFKSCSQLDYLDVILSDDRNLKILGKFIPKNLRKINFGLENVIDFKESLVCFFNEYANNIGLLKCLEFKCFLFWYDDKLYWLYYNKLTIGN